MNKYLERVRENPDTLADLGELQQDPTVCLAAVERDGLALRHVIIQTPEICRVAVEQNPEAAQYARIPEAVYLERWDPKGPRVEGYGEALKTMVTQTEEACVWAVRTNADALKYVREQTPTICWAAILKSGLALRYVGPDMKTPELCLAAVEKAPMSLQYVDDQRPLICAAAILTRPLTVRYMRKDAPYLQEFSRLAIKMDPRAQIYLKKRVKEKEAA